MKRNFNLKMHLACSKDNLRPALQHVCFENGNMIATDAHILIKAKVSLFSSFTDEEIEILNGKFINSDTFMKILKCKEVMITDAGVIDSNTGCIYAFADDLIFGSAKYPKHEEVLKDLVKTEIDCISVNPSVLNNISKILSKELTECILIFNGKNKAIKIAHSEFLESDFTALLMPMSY